MPTLANDLVQFLMSLFGSQQAAREFLDDPEKVLEDHGLGRVCSADVDAALPVVLDYAPITLNHSSFDREYSTGGNSAWTGHNGGGWAGAGHTPPPAGGGHHDHDDHAHAVQQLHYVVNSYSYTSTVDDRDTITDQSVNQNIWADGDVNQWFDNDSVVASGDRSIAAGDDAYVKDSNNIEDSYNTDNSADNSTDNSITAGGDVNIGNEETDIDDSFNTDLDVDVEDSFNDNSDNSTNTTVEIEDSFQDNSDNSDNSITDSYNDNRENTETVVAIEDSFQDNSETTKVEESFNDNSSTETTTTEHELAVENSFNDESIEYEESFNDNSSTETDVEVDGDESSAVVI